MELSARYGQEKDSAFNYSGHVFYEIYRIN
jgi:hypothetical protein